MFLSVLAEKKWGKRIVVGIGPGNEENMTLRAQHAQEQCDVIVGYHIYVDLVKNRYPVKKYSPHP